MNKNSQSPTFKDALLYIVGLKKTLDPKPKQYIEDIFVLPEEDDLDKNGIPDWLEKDEIAGEKTSPEPPESTTSDKHVPDWLDDEIATLGSESADVLEPEFVPETMQTVIEADEDIPDWLAKDILAPFTPDTQIPEEAQEDISDTKESLKKTYDLKQVLESYSHDGRPEESVYDALEEEHKKNIEAGKEWVEKRKQQSPTLQSKEEELTHADEYTNTESDMIGQKKNSHEQKVESKKRETDVDAVVFGIDEDGDTISVDTQTRLRHTYVVGMTGMGKTTLLESSILQDIQAGRGVGLIDPHGDLYDRIIQQIPKHRINDVVIFDPSDTEYPVGFNILENAQDQLPSLVTSSMVGVFKKLYGHSWGPRMEYILRNASLTLLEKKGSTLLTLARLLSDSGYRSHTVRSLENAYLKRFWEEEFATLSPSRQAEVVSPILNKIGQFLSIPLIRNIIAQPKSSFSPRWIMDNNKIFLANVGKGFIGEDVSEMLGSLLVSKFYLDAASRSDVAPDARNPFFLYVDEFQNFATDSFAHILSESRKYGLALTLAHQYIGQLDMGLQEAIFGNTATMVAFKLGYADAKKLAPVYGDMITSSAISSLPKYAFITHTNDGDSQHVRSGYLKQPEHIDPETGAKRKEKIQRVTREKFAKKREFVEEKLEG